MKAFSGKKESNKKGKGEPGAKNSPNHLLGPNPCEIATLAIANGDVSGPGCNALHRGVKAAGDAVLERRQVGLEAAPRAVDQHRAAGLDIAASGAAAVRIRDGDLLRGEECRSWVSVSLGTNAEGLGK